MTMSCHCPICKQGDIPTLPFGVPFAGKLRVESVTETVVKPVYENHHSYMPETPTVNITHHGVFLGSYLVGCITYRHPLIQSLNGVDGSDIIEVARVCIVPEMPNLASAALARSQDRFIKQEASRRGIRLLLTFVRADYEGSMVKALSDKGWEFTGTVEAGQAGNRPYEEVRDYEKDRYLYEVESSTEQTTLV